jgi:pimeloyl-ACP methyl ester carboxylesterase
LDHLVRRGNIVIYPRYQADLLSLVSEFTGNAIAAIRSALTRLQTEKGHVRPDLKKFAVVGHSMGGLLTANVAALAAESGLPMVRAMMPVEPGRTNNPLDLFVLDLADLGKIPADTLLLSVVGEDDGLVGDHDGKRIFNEATKVTFANKDFITLMSDDRGEPALAAGHYAPTGADARYDNGERIPARDNSIPAGPIRDRIRERIGNRQHDPNADPEERENGDRAGAESTNRRGVDALDYALWRLFDALCDAAFYGKNRRLALGNTADQRFMGRWSDGTPVKELIVVGKP